MPQAIRCPDSEAGNRIVSSLKQVVFDAFHVFGLFQNLKRGARCAEKVAVSGDGETAGHSAFAGIVRLTVDHASISGNSFMEQRRGGRRPLGFPRLGRFCRRKRWKR